jgi:long-chain acyl-CoA synthetase
MFHIADAEFIYGVTTLGGAHYSIPKYEPGAFLEAVERWRITDVVLVPTMIQMLLDHPNLATTDTSSLQRLWYGGSPLAEQTIVRLMAALPKVSPIQLYGQTESAPILTTLEAADHNPPPEHRRRLRAAGRPLPGCEIAIVDENDRPLPAGEVGEIVARSGTLMLGYWQDEEQTAQALKGGWLHTGDAGYMDDDGYVFVTDRFKDMIISGGENIYSVEVEQAIYAYPGVAQCAVIGLADERWGEAVHAVMVPQPGHEIDLGELRAALREKLAGYKIPQSFEIRYEPLPISGAGKILKRELRRQAEEGL